MSEQEKLQTILNLRPLCKKEVEEDACQTICSFVKKSYDIVQRDSDMNILLTLVQ